MRVTEEGSAGRRHRRMVVATAGAAAAVLLLGSAAWACTQRVGTLLVCRPPASTYVSAAQCGKMTSTAQTGNPTLYKRGSIFSVKATNFYAKRYQVSFKLTGTGGGNCLVPGATSPLLTSVSPSIAGSAPGGTTSFMGPSFQAEFASPSQTTPGQARVCVMDVPDRVTGQILNLSVI